MFMLFFGRADARSGVHGHRYGHVAGDEQRTLDCAGIGALVVVIRNWGGLPEAAHVFDPADERARAVHQSPTQPRVFGVERKARRPHERRAEHARRSPDQVGTPGRHDGGRGAVAGLLIIVVFQATLPAILANRAARLDAALSSVVPGLERYDTLYLLDGKLTSTAPPVSTPRNGKDLRRFRRPRAAASAAIPTSEPGFQDAIDILFGFDPAKPGTLGLAVTRHEGDTGARRQDPLRRIPGSVQGCKDTRHRREGKGASQKPEDVDMITGATISSRTVIRAINKAVEKGAAHRRA